ncbi:hypothetical protein ACS0TY_003827 [Phlomoides rotata]
MRVYDDVFAGSEARDRDFTRMTGLSKDQVFYASCIVCLLVEMGTLLLDREEDDRISAVMERLEEEEERMKMLTMTTQGGGGFN